MTRVKGAVVTASTSSPALEPLLLDEHQAAALLGISFSSCRELVAAGELPLVRLPAPMDPTKRIMRRKLIDRRDVLDLIERCKSGGAR